MSRRLRAWNPATKTDGAWPDPAMIGPQWFRYSARLGSALESTSYLQAVTSMDEVPDIFLGHLRKASDDIPVTLANAHPFFHDGWAFIHNGTVYDAESLPRDASLMPTSDESDTEFLFHYLLTALITNPINKGISAKLAVAVSSLQADYTSVNSMLSNGARAFCHQWL